MSTTFYNPAFVRLEGGVPQAEAALIAESKADSYFNIHTTNFPGGVDPKPAVCPRCPRPHRRCWPSWPRAVAFSAGGDGGRRSPEHLAMAVRNLWLLGIWLELLKKVIPFRQLGRASAMTLN